MAKYHYMGLVDIMLSSFLGDEEHFVKEEESSLILCMGDVEGSLEDELTVRSEVRPFPVDEEGLNLLKKTRQVPVRMHCYSGHLCSQSLLKDTV